MWNVWLEKIGTYKLLVLIDNSHRNNHISFDFDCKIKIMTFTYFKNFYWKTHIFLIEKMDFMMFVIVCGIE